MYFSTTLTVLTILVQDVWWSYQTIFKLRGGASRTSHVGRSVGPSVGRSVGRSVGPSVGRSVGRSVGPWKILTIFDIKVS